MNLWLNQKKNVNVNKNTALKKIMMMVSSTGRFGLCRVCLFWLQIQTLSSDKKCRVGSLTIQWYASH